MQEELKKFSVAQLFNFCIGFFGLQFAWQMRIILSGPVTESLGASPLIFGLIWLAGPISGIIVQPIIGALSDTTQTKFGRRVPYLLLGALFGSLGLILLPHSGYFASLFGENAPALLGLCFAAIMIWLIDACVNAAQGPYRALIPDNIPKSQHAEANSYLSFAIGLGSVVAAGTAPFLKYAFNFQMSVSAQFLMAGIAFMLGMLWTCITIRERQIKQEELEVSTEVANTTFAQKIKEFFAISPEVTKICAMQFFTWIGLMSLMIFFTQFVVHILYQVPDLTLLDAAQKAVFDEKNAQGQNFSSICFAVFNLICFIIALPIGYFATKYGNKIVHFVSLLTMAAAYLVMAMSANPVVVMVAMAIAGIGWASTLALPFAMLSNYIKPGTEGSVMGIFNIFIAAPQVLVCTLLAWFIDASKFTQGGYQNNHWEYAFIVGAAMLIISAIISISIKENK